MTASDEARRAFADLRGGIVAERADSSASVGEQLAAARARKRVDIRRAERDTTIRGRYLQALERDDEGGIADPVYAIGFLRAYAGYLGLDPEDTVAQWRRERGRPRRPDTRPMPARRVLRPRRLQITLSRTVGVAALLTAVVAAVAVFLGVQLLRYARPPALGVTAPAVAVVTVDESSASYVLRGTSVAGASISIATPGRERPYRVSAGSDGTWQAEVDLRRGPNQFDITATDPTSGKAAEQPAQVFIRVPLPAFAEPTKQP
jgi:cytoskeletal protein RodZ